MKFVVHVGHEYGLLSKLGPAKKLFEMVSIDTVGGFGGK